MFSRLRKSKQPREAPSPLRRSQTVMNFCEQRPTEEDSSGIVETNPSRTPVLSVSPKPSCLPEQSGISPRSAAAASSPSMFDTEKPVQPQQSALDVSASPEAVERQMGMNHSQRLRQMIDWHQKHPQVLKDTPGSKLCAQLTEAVMNLMERCRKCFVMSVDSKLDLLHLLTEGSTSDRDRANTGVLFFEGISRPLIANKEGQIFVVLKGAIKAEVLLASALVEEPSDQLYVPIDMGNCLFWLPALYNLPIIEKLLDHFIKLNKKGKTEQANRDIQDPMRIADLLDLNKNSYFKTIYPNTIGPNSISAIWIPEKLKEDWESQRLLENLSCLGIDINLY